MQESKSTTFYNSCQALQNVFMNFLFYQKYDCEISSLNFQKSCVDFVNQISHFPKIPVETLWMNLTFSENSRWTWISSSMIFHNFKVLPVVWHTYQDWWNSYIPIFTNFTCPKILKPTKDINQSLQIFKTSNIKYKFAYPLPPILSWRTIWQNLRFCLSFEIVWHSIFHKI